LQNRTQPCVDHGNDWHEIAVSPGFTDLDVQPFAEYRVAETEDQRSKENTGPLRLRPRGSAEQQKRQKEGAERDQDIATGAVNRRKDDLPQRSGQPDRLERHMREFPDKVRDSGEDEIPAQRAQPIARLRDISEWDCCHWKISKMLSRRPG
jgi:hypothetical protein